MSALTRPLVTIDDPVTIIEPHRVLLEWVDQVHREGFYVRSTTSGSHITIGALEKNRYRHDREGTTWARGHHLPDSEVVVALRAAASLVESEGARGSAQNAPSGPQGRVGYAGPHGAGPQGNDDSFIADYLKMAGIAAPGSLGDDYKKLVEDARRAAESVPKKPRRWWRSD